MAAITPPASSAGAINPLRCWGSDDGLSRLMRGKAARIDAGQT
jgi:hypothetical protein